MLKLLLLFFLFQSSHNRYWEDYSPYCQQRILHSKEVAEIVSAYLEKKWTLTDDNRTFLLLEELTSSQSDSIKALYFSVFNSILVLNNNDAAIGESITEYVYKYFCKDPVYIINYIPNHPALISAYKHGLALYCYFTDRDVISLREEIKESVSPKEYRKWFDAFFSDIETSFYRLTD